MFLYTPPSVLWHLIPTMPRDECANVWFCSSGCAILRVTIFLVWLMVLYTTVADWIFFSNPTGIFSKADCVNVCTHLCGEGRGRGLIWPDNSVGGARQPILSKNWITDKSKLVNRCCETALRQTNASTANSCATLLFLQVGDKCRNIRKGRRMMTMKYQWLFSPCWLHEEF